MLAWRFINSMITFPPQCEHNLVVLTDYGHEQEAGDIFSFLPNVRTVGTPDHAKDLSRYEAYVRQSLASCVMLLGGSSYCRKPGWALRAFTAFQRMGAQNLYGTCGHTGSGGVRPHIRSTGMWASPELLRRYPGWPRDYAGRYQAEHGLGCLSDWVRSQGGQCWVINLGSEYTLDRANDDPQGYQKGSQQALLIGDRLCCPPYFPYA